MRASHTTSNIQSNRKNNHHPRQACRECNTFDAAQGTPCSAYPLIENSTHSKRSEVIAYLEGGMVVAATRVGLNSRCAFTSVPIFHPPLNYIGQMDLFVDSRETSGSCVRMMWPRRGTPQTARRLKDTGGYRCVSQSKRTSNDDSPNCPATRSAISTLVMVMATSRVRTHEFAGRVCDVLCAEVESGEGELRRRELLPHQHWPSPQLRRLTSDGLWTRSNKQHVVLHT